MAKALVLKYIETVGKKRNIQSCLKQISEELWDNSDLLLTTIKILIRDVKKPETSCCSQS